MDILGGWKCAEWKIKKQNAKAGQRQSQRNNNDNSARQKGLLKAHKRKRHVYKADAHVLVHRASPSELVHTRTHAYMVICDPQYPSPLFRSPLKPTHLVWGTRAHKSALNEFNTWLNSLVSWKAEKKNKSSEHSHSEDVEKQQQKYGKQARKRERERKRKREC